MTGFLFSTFSLPSFKIRLTMGRPQNKKKPAPSKAKTKKPKEPTTFEEFMEGKTIESLWAYSFERSNDSLLWVVCGWGVIDAVGFEEQGERYATGDRAQRNYERALDMYSKAHALNDQDADCVYNW